MNAAATQTAANGKDGMGNEDDVVGDDGPPPLLDVPVGGDGEAAVGSDKGGVPLGQAWEASSARRF